MAKVADDRYTDPIEGPSGPPPQGHMGFPLRRAAILILVSAGCSNSNEPKDPTPGGVTTITVSPANPVLEVGGTRALVGVAKDANGQTVNVTLTWATSNSAVAAVDANGTVTAAAAGTANITASFESVHSSAVAVTVTAPAPWPTTGASSVSLIEAAVTAGTITAEQGLIYKVYASFVDPRLPPAYRGVIQGNIDDPILKEASQKFATLSPATQAALTPFFRTPDDPDGWYAARVPLGTSVPMPSSGVAAPGRARSTRGSAQDCPGIDHLFSRRSTTHFAVHFPIGDLNGTAVADIITPELERIYITETEAFGRVPVSDAAVTGQPNGCDGLLDIWILPAIGLLGLGREDDPRKGAVAWTTMYNVGCAPSPSFIGMWAVPFPDPKKMKAALAHEFWHVLEVGSYNHGGTCLSEYDWMGEATGNWAIDLVYPTDQWEQDYAAGYAFAERLVPLDEAYGNNRDKTNGYCDYVFLLYLARTYGNSAVKDIWDATAGAKSVEAIVAALQSRGGIKQVWPEFALAEWNNYKDSDHDELHFQDDLTWGMREAFDLADAGGPNGRRSDSVDLRGGKNRNIELMASTENFPSGHDLPRLSIHVDYLKFTDQNVASVLYTNGLAFADFPNLKIQVLIKQGGSWKPVEDWTKKLYQSYCRDLASQRIQEMVLIYSNSDGNRPSDPIPIGLTANVGVSNVGCAKWTGTSSIVVTAADGGSNTQATNLVFDREVLPGAPDGAGQQAFVSTSGDIIGSSSATCFSSSAAGPVVQDDGRILISLDNLFFSLPGTDPPDRLILQGVGDTRLSTTTTICTGGSSTGDNVWSWMEIPVLDNYAVSNDGRHMTGEVTTTGAFGSQTVKWDLTAVREP